MQELMPSEARRQYLTYEGSLTQPSCQETVQWILLNKPVYMTSHLFHSLRTAMSSENSHGADNFRPTQKLNSRTVRTNIDFVAPSSTSSSSSHHQVRKKEKYKEKERKRGVKLNVPQECNMFHQTIVHKSFVPVSFCLFLYAKLPSLVLCSSLVRFSLLFLLFYVNLFLLLV